MEMRYFLGMLILLCCSNSVGAYSSYSNTNLVDQIKPNPITRSKPTAPHIKYASVQFLQSDTQLNFASDKIDIKMQCAALGYAIPASSCTGIMKPGKACSSESGMTAAEANNYVLGCCNSELYTVDSPSSCADNSTSVNDFCVFRDGGKKYRCKCDRTMYPYNEDDNPCSGDYNQYGTCKAPVMMSTGSAVTKTFYSSCCPSTYQVCDGKMSGEGGFCTVKSGESYEIKYQNCVCSSSYDTICSGMMIDPSDYCTDDKHPGKKLTRSTNCEGTCTLTRETNIDNYLYGNVWHCLYKSDGASIKIGEDGLCDGISKITGTLETDYYDECTAQGYNKSEEDCYSADLILRCPNDTSRVWCLDGRYCTGYDVGSLGSTDTCYRTVMSRYGYNPAKISYCPSIDSSKGTRCRYESDRCNSCWEDGLYKPTAAGCVPTESGATTEETKKIERGYGGLCCNLGYRFKNGQCTAVTCSETDYPYDDNPGDYEGKLELCFAGKADNSGYTTHYGYDGCYTKDNTAGGIWQADPSNPRKCVCDRQDDLRGWLPFNSTLYFDQNFADPYGFYEGRYGVQNSCTDSTGSYYGYLSCYISSIMSSSEKGKCLPYTAVSYTSAHPYHQNYAEFTNLGNILTKVKLNSTDYFATMAKVSHPITNKLPDKNKVYCINYYTHCVDKNSCTTAADGTETCTKKVGTDAVCEQAKTCPNGYESECSKCYSVKNLLQDKNGNIIKNSSGLYDVHGIFTLKAETYNNGGGIEFGFEKCPTNYQGTSGIYLGGSTSIAGFGGCFKYCYTDALSECIAGDILRDRGKTVNLGIVYGKTSANIYIGGFGTNTDTAVVYNTAVTNITSFAPTGNTNSKFAAGEWCIPTKDEISSGIISDGGTWPLYTTYKFLGRTHILRAAWTSSVVDANTVYTRNCCSSTNAAAKTSKYYMFPVIVLRLSDGANVTSCKTTSG